ncbi:MAG: xylan 1,4-beta-xylosidase [Novosphingobium sp. 28-62-57]|uniref:family 43 glycosylhydrolase n=1 Tax=unclassified Novosphingobium TaxID=2644732 RepID=UPI000BC5E7D9|nr:MULTISPECIES: family 43 glycosylhydrolase [unclassified Novosphingobium]OYW51280.1 MAG: xylan 1,4-beta-xylosidase [Novosphingobium sp. 12-62-10]OYZ10581.1 MAG: xylan 1,4-beta-xylosidase [Novosphingobium sp. 28-62-57]OZA37190.1 MAG: xylan 1,4-beta-xylosidase [Novosphingobium sp. 17-62-9]HQS68057.1 family 43 glycosylhydrolase [Novosphingobium sp.]
MANTQIDRRGMLALGGMAAASAVAPVAALAAPAPERASTQSNAAPSRWGKGIEGQRKADLGNGMFRNPILAGDYADPSILKDGDDYYMTHSSFDAAPGLLIWHSRDLVNWVPLGPALAQPIAIGFAVDLVKHAGRYFIYIPFIPAPWSAKVKDAPQIWVIHADAITGPWSEPVDLGIKGAIDPGHVVGEDGKRYLFLSGIERVQLTDDGLATAGPVAHAYDGWKYPDEWITEAYALEGPKLLRRSEWFYIITAVGGTSGPATGHMVTAARSRSVNGPWENCPHNPIIRTKDAGEAWWSRGHATAVEGPRGQWYFVYHGYENGYRSLGRQTLLEPFEWTSDGWPRALGGDLSQALPMPTGRAGGPHGFARSDSFATSSLGTRWTGYGLSPDEAARIAMGGGKLVLQGKGTGPADGLLVTQGVGDLAYEITVSVELEGEVEGGLLLFYNRRLFLGMGLEGAGMKSYRGGQPMYWREPAPLSRTMHLRIVNDHQIVTFYYSLDGKNWTRHGVRSEVSGYNANTSDELASLRPALFAAGKGQAVFRDFRYRALG